MYVIKSSLRIYTYWQGLLTQLNVPTFWNIPGVLEQNTCLIVVAPSNQIGDRKQKLRYWKGEAQIEK